MMADYAEALAKAGQAVEVAAWPIVPREGHPTLSGGRALPPVPPAEEAPERSIFRSDPHRP